MTAGAFIVLFAMLGQEGVHPVKAAGEEAARAGRKAQARKRLKQALAAQRPRPCHCEARSAAAVHGASPRASAAWMAAGLTALAMTAKVWPEAAGARRDEGLNR